MDGREAFQAGSTLIGIRGQIRVAELFQWRALCQRHLWVVEHTVDQRDDPTRIIECTCLLHIVVALYCRVTPFLIHVFLLRQPSNARDSGEAWLRQEREQLFIEAEHLGEGPSLQPEPFREFGKNRGVRLKRRPMKSSSSFCCHCVCPM